MENKMVLVEGIITPEDIPRLNEMGVVEDFISGTYISQVAEFIRSRIVEASDRRSS